MARVSLIKKLPQTEIIFSISRWITCRQPVMFPQQIEFVATNIATWGNVGRARDQRDIIYLFIIINVKFTQYVKSSELEYPCRRYSTIIIGIGREIKGITEWTTQNTQSLWAFARTTRLPYSRCDLRRSKSYFQHGALPSSCRSIRITRLRVVDRQDSLRQPHIGRSLRQCSRKYVTS